jgi:hypothetical protein
LRPIVPSPEATSRSKPAERGKRGTVVPDTFVIDRTPPRTILVGRYSGDWYTTSPTITLNATDDLSGVAAIYYQLVPHGSGTPKGTLPGKWLPYKASFSPASDGDFDLWAMSVDQVGNQEQPVLLHELRIDTTPPTPALGLRANAGEDNIRLTWTTASDATSGLDGYALYMAQAASCPPTDSSSYRVVRTTMNTSANLGLQKGKAYCFYIVVSDAAGLQSEASNVASASIAAPVAPADTASPPVASQAPVVAQPTASQPAPAPVPASAPPPPASVPVSSQPAVSQAPAASQPASSPPASAPVSSQPVASQPAPAKAPAASAPVSAHSP